MPYAPCCPFCERPGPPCRGDAKAECGERARRVCSCRRDHIRPGAAVVTPYGPGTVAEVSSYLREGQHVASVEVPRAAYDGPVPDPAPRYLSMHPSDSWLVMFPGEQHCYVWYLCTLIHRPGCWKLGA